MAPDRRQPAEIARLLLGVNPVRRAIYVLGLAPAGWYFYRGLTGQLGIDPQNILERALGLWAMRFLVLSLAITPLRQFGGPNLIRYRRAIGLLAFYYATLHLTVYMLLDKDLEVAAIVADVIRRPYVTLGMGAFVILVPLAITSNATMIRTLGGMNWQRLHRLVYVAAIAGALHFIMLVKAWLLEPLIYAAAVVVLLFLRLVRCR